MITIFNRKELFITFSMKKQGAIRDILRANHIDYIVRTVNQMGSGKRMGAFGEKRRSANTNI